METKFYYNKEMVESIYKLVQLELSKLLQNLPVFKSHQLNNKEFTYLKNTLDDIFKLVDSVISVRENFGISDQLDLSTSLNKYFQLQQDSHKLL